MMEPETNLDTIIFNLGATSSPSDSSKKIVIKVSKKQDHEFFYNKVRTWTFRELIKIAVNDPNSFACLLYGGQIIKANSKVADYHTNFQADPSPTLILLKGEKLQFYKNLKPNPSINTSMAQLNPTEKQDVGQKSSELKQPPEICEPITMYTCCFPLFREVNCYFRELNLESSLQTTDEWKVQFSNCLIKALERLPNYIGNVHRGMRNFHLIHNEGDVFCWKSFTSTGGNQSTAFCFAGPTGTVFHIQSLTGKEITKFCSYSSEQQIVFTPFTYFIIDRILKAPNKYDQVWLREMPSPITWKRNLLLWVDDNPTNNISIIQEILKSGNVQVLQLTSTDMAEKWMKEFSQILLWADVKIISNIVRVEKTVESHYAGVDLIKLFFDDYGYTTPILLYCSSVSKGQQHAVQSKVGKDRIFGITDNLDVVMKFCQF